MAFAWTLGLRYLRSKKRAFISVGTLFAILGVALGVAALATVMSVTGGFQKQFRDKVLGVNAHVLILKRTPEFHEYRLRMEQARKIPGVTGVAPFVINPMLVTAGDKTATGVLMKGIDPDLMPLVLDLPKHIVQGSTAGLRRPGAKPPERPKGVLGFDDTVDDLGQLAGTSTTGAASSSGAPGVPPSTSASGAPRDPFLELLEKKHAQVKKENDEIAKREAEEAAAAASGKVAAAKPAPSPSSSAAAPSGEIEPTGGYSSELPPDDAEEKAIKAITDAEKAKEAEAGLPGIVIGRTLAKNLGVGLGERIRVTSPAVGFSFTGSSRAPVARQFKVIAIFEAGFDQYDSKLVYVDLFEAQAFYDQGDSVTGVEMRVGNIDDAREIKGKIEKMLNNGVYHVMDWEELNHPLFTALKIQQIGMSAVLALIILVAAFTVVATLIMVVLDKRKEIAVLKAMGARDSAILRAFLYQGLIIGAVGTALGLALGFAMCRGLLVYAFPLDPKVYFISKLPVEVRFQEFALTGLIAIVICLAATVFPAYNAATIRPADGLRAQ